MLYATLLPDTEFHKEGINFLSLLLSLKRDYNAHTIDLSLFQLPPNITPIWGEFMLLIDNVLAPNTKQTIRIKTMAKELAGTQSLHAVVYNNTARLWLRDQHRNITIGWHSPPPAPLHHPCLQAWLHLQNGENILLGAKEISAHARLEQAAIIERAPIIKLLHEKFTESQQPARLWRRDPYAIILHDNGPRGNIMANSFLALTLPNIAKNN